MKIEIPFVPNSLHGRRLGHVSCVSRGKRGTKLQKKAIYIQQSKHFETHSGRNM